MGLVYILAGFVLLTLLGAVVYYLRLARHRGVPREASLRSSLPRGFLVRFPPMSTITTDRFAVRKTSALLLTIHSRSYSDWCTMT
jgi:hypothetical protein